MALVRLNRGEFTVQFQREGVMLDLGAIDARDLDLAGLRSRLEERIGSQDIEDKIVRIAVRNVSY